MNPNILVGFHAHDNMSLSMANTITALDNGADMIDGTYTGIGRGGGNLPLELRQDAIQRLLDFKNEYVFEFSFMIRNTIEGTVGYLKQPQLKNYKQNLKDFIDYTEILDKERNQSFNDIDKELYTEIKKIAR